ncbi:MAG: formylglycine-generating enzyme family protein [Aquificaceae bacterium]|nr:MAG: formylglycine-generating enzyme family protein [Aquificaceae bacterium]
MNDHSTSKSPHLPDLSTEEIIELQHKASSELNLPRYFSDNMKIGGSAPEMAIIPRGLFEMGSNSSEFGHYKDEYPQHYIQINKPFAIGRYTITSDDFEIFREDTEWHLRPELLWAKGKEPVMNIRLADMQLYLKWLSEQTGEVYRLPTEAEWEYAARAGTSTAFHFGETTSCKEVHFDSTAPYEEAKQKKRWFLPKCFPMPKAIPVGSKPANSWGLHEVHGNVWEFTSTQWRNSHLNTNRDGSNSGISSTPWYVTKGGSWFDPAVLARSAARKKRLDDEMDTNLGFRVVREL